MPEEIKEFNKSLNAWFDKHDCHYPGQRKELIALIDKYRPAKDISEVKTKEEVLKKIEREYPLSYDGQIGAAMHNLSAYNKRSAAEFGYSLSQDKGQSAEPVHGENQDELWKEAIDLIDLESTKSECYSYVVNRLKNKYTITKK